MAAAKKKTKPPAKSPQRGDKSSAAKKALKPSAKGKAAAKTKSIKPKAAKGKAAKSVRKAPSAPVRKGASTSAKKAPPAKVGKKASSVKAAKPKAARSSPKASPARHPAPKPAAAMVSGERTIPPKQPPTAPDQPDLKVGDDAVMKATGKNWAQWCEVLDAAGGRAMAHSDIARLVFERFRVGPWWAQMVTVGYEQARGTREAHQRPDGFSVSATKTIAAPAERVYAAWNVDADRARWLGVNLKVRSATPPKSIRLLWSDQLSPIVVMLYSRGAKTQVAVEHNKLKDQAEVERMKGYWSAALNRLAAALGAR